MSTGPRTLVIIQARMGSTRLPGKVLMPLAGEPMLSHVVRRAAAAKGVDGVVVATTTKASDDPVVELTQRIGALFFRGSEDDVLARYVGAAREHGAELVVRVTSDCPLYDTALLEEMLAARAALAAAQRVDVYCNIFGQRTYPRGLDTEIVDARVLAQLADTATDPRAREHVTWGLYQEPARYSLHNHVQREGRDDSARRWTVDTPADYEMVRRVYDALAPGNPLFGFAETLAWLHAHPEVAALNADIEQKKI